MGADSDEIRRAQEGDREAFAALVRRHQRRVYATAYRVVGNHSDADDLMQEAFLRAYRALKTFDGRSDFFTWLYRIVINLALNHLRSVQRQRTSQLDDSKLPPGWDQSATDPRRQTEAKDLYQRVADAIQSLPPTLRVTVVLALIEELPHKQVGEILGCSEGTIAWRVNQARKVLRQRLGSVLPTPTGGTGGATAKDATPAASGEGGKPGPGRAARGALLARRVARLVASGAPLLGFFAGLGLAPPMSLEEA
ncbi:MAG: sigma-70 family RNA polymerase sigma factor [Deltaproteobacteria bacterium]|nr:sigma-70 family RNA polymerase sigma factor [Deltaproteobacteria bacterium]